MSTPFTTDVIEQLQYYVYRLIDPRTGLTFYVGKGQGNRVFDHVNYALNKYNGKFYIDEEEDDLSAKIQQIRDIDNAGLEVIHVIHRYGLTSKEAFEVESALIDAYGGLTNIQSGHANDRGVNNADVIQKVLSRGEYTEPDFNDFRYIIIKIKDAVLQERTNDLYETVRSAWIIGQNKLDQIDNYQYCFAVLNGVVRGVYKINEWHECPAVKGRYEFTGEEADDIKNDFIDKRIPQKYRERGMANPVLYSDSEKTK